MTDPLNEGMVHGFYDARISNDVSTILDVFHDDGRLELVGQDMGVETFAKPDDAPDAFRRQVERLVAIWDWKSIEVHDLLISGEQAAVRYTLHAVFNPTGEAVETEIMDLITVRDGRVVRILQFVDTALVAALSQRAQAGAP